MCRWCSDLKKSGKYLVMLVTKKSAIIRTYFRVIFHFPKLFLNSSSLSALLSNKPGASAKTRQPYSELVLHPRPHMARVSSRNFLTPAAESILKEKKINIF